MKKKMMIVSALSLATLALGGWGFAQDDKASKDITGEIVDMNCYMDHAAHGEGHKACGIACAKAGNPIGIVTADGKVYLLLASDKHEPKSTNDKLIEKMSETVTVTGKVNKRGGLEAVTVESIK